MAGFLEGGGGGEPDTPAPTTVMSIGSALDEDAHGAPATDDALAVAAHGLAVDEVDLRHEAEAAVKPVILSARSRSGHDAAIGLELDGVGALVVGDSVGMLLALAVGEVTQLVEDAERAGLAGLGEGDAGERRRP
jgi:hypothetical protein